MPSQTKKKAYPNHSPKTAAILSAIAPGAGQIYNKKYWKLPIVWAGLAGLGYLWVNENNRYQDAKISYLSLLDTDVSNDIPFNGITNVTVVQSTKNVYRNQRDMYLLFGILFYGLNIIDATVDAHFMNFDVLKICKKALENKYYVLSKELFLEKVFKKLGFMFSNNDIQAVINCTPNGIFFFH